MNNMYPVIDPEGQMVGSSVSGLSDDVLQNIYSLMMTARLAENKGFRLQPQIRDRDKARVTQGEIRIVKTLPLYLSVDHR